jgi:hypothetical protein
MFAPTAHLSLEQMSLPELKQSIEIQQAAANSSGIGIARLIELTYNMNRSDGMSPLGEIAAYLPYPYPYLVKSQLATVGDITALAAKDFMKNYDNLNSMQKMLFEDYKIGLFAKANS